MLMSEYSAAPYISVVDVQKPKRGIIKDVSMGSFDKPVMKLETGEKLSLNKTNVAILIKAFGEDSRDWAGCEVEMYAGQIPYQGTSKDAVLVRPISEDE